MEPRGTRMPDGDPKAAAADLTGSSCLLRRESVEMALSGGAAMSAFAPLSGE